MGKVSINVNGRAFAVGCEDGEESAVAELGEQFNGHVCELAEQVGQIGDLRLFLMAALVLADELREAKRTCANLEAQMTDSQSANAEGTRKKNALAQSAAHALNEAAGRIEKLADRLDNDKSA
jgi:cell division protein ZapA